MNMNQALNVFGVDNNVTLPELKTIYKKLAVKHHPDKNPQTGADMMKMVNAAYDFLCNNFELIQNISFESASFYNYSDDFERVLKTVSELDGLVYEVIGNWLWISGETKKHREVLHGIGCKWASKKKQWFYRPDEHKSFNRKELTLEEIRERYGSEGMKRSKGKKAIKQKS